MPVLVTPGLRPLARRLAGRLLEEGGQVRVFAADDAPALRAAGAFVAAGDLDDEGRLEAASAGVHTVVHVPGEPLTAEPSAIEDEARVVARAAGNAGVARVIALSVPGADEHATDPVRRAFGIAERAYAAVSCPSIVVRTSLVDDPSTRQLLATAGLGDDELAAEVAPVSPDDLVELLVAFDDARAASTGGHLVVAADGPVKVSVDDYLTRVGASRPGRGSLVGQRVPSESERRRLRQVLVGGAWTTDESWVVDGWAFARLQPTAPGPGREAPS